MKKPSKNTIQRQQKKKEQRKVKSRLQQKERRRKNQEQSRCVAYQMCRIIAHYFPHLFDWMREIEDCRSKSEYQLTEIIVACLSLFLFKAGSRNEQNNLQNDPKFRKNYKKLFKLNLPHPDTVFNVMKILDEVHLEKLKRRMIQVLINRKTFHQSRFQGQWFLVAVYSFT
jgi:hypothetical protein